MPPYYTNNIISLCAIVLVCARKVLRNFNFMFLYKTNCSNLQRNKDLNLLSLQRFRLASFSKAFSIWWFQYIDVKYLTNLLCNDRSSSLHPLPSSDVFHAYSHSWDSRAIPFDLPIHRSRLWYFLDTYRFNYLSFHRIVPDSIDHFHLKFLLCVTMMVPAVFPQDWVIVFAF